MTIIQGVTQKNYIKLTPISALSIVSKSLFKFVYVVFLVIWKGEIHFTLIQDHIK